jgi:hypothetical protein
MTNLRRRILGSFLALAFLLAWLFTWVREPELQLSTGGPVPVAVFPLADGRFEHVFTHSVHRTPVRELFRVEAEGNEATLHLYELRYQSQGVGMPADAEGGYRLEGNTFVLAMDRSFRELPIMVSPVAGHGIVTGGVFQPFTFYQQPGQRLVLSARMTRHIRLRR